ncbi:uncharacterized protein LOC134260129 [Saccostrea cucullata]|uniref:uncharacterized protein LOC134260129 n=1 Tax=Saccostrea cuccullata TaxID=36930 RepID=UPI002ED31C58
MAAFVGEAEMIDDQTLSVDSNDAFPTTKRRGRPISSGLSIFRAFLLEKGLHASVETNYTSKQLDGLLTNFYMELKRTDGKHYDSLAVRVIQSALRKHFLKLRNEDIVISKRFTTSNRMFHEVYTKSFNERDFRENPLNRRIIQKIPIHPDDIDKLYNTAFSTDSPRSLKQKVMFEYIYFFCESGFDHIRLVQKEDFVFSRDASGREYVTVRERYTMKNKFHCSKLKQNRGKIVMQPVRMYDRQGDPMCPVASLKKYLMKLSPENPFFWQRPKTKYNHSDVVWYEAETIRWDKKSTGKVSLWALMKNLSVESNLSKIYCNSNIRATNIQILNNQPEEACQISATIGCETDQSIEACEISATIGCETDQSIEACEISATIGSETDQSAHRSLYPDCQDYFVISVERDSPTETDHGHQDSCKNCDNERDTCTPIKTDLGQQESCSDDKTDTSIRNEYRNILFGEAANAWKQLIGRFDWLHDSEIAQHLIEVHEVHCMRKGVCPLERTPEARNASPIHGTRSSDGIPTRESEETEDIPFQSEVDEDTDSVDEDADSIDDDSSDDSDPDLEDEEVASLEEIREALFSMDNAPQNPGSTQQAENRVSNSNQEAVISWGDNPFQASSVVNQEPAESYSNTGNSTVTNVNSSSPSTRAFSEVLNLPQSETVEPVMRSSSPSSNICESLSTHVQNTLDTPEVIWHQTADIKTEEIGDQAVDTWTNVAQAPLHSTLLTKQTLNSDTGEANQEIPPASREILIKQERQASSDETIIIGGQKISLASVVRGQWVSPASGVGGQQSLPASGVTKKTEELQDSLDSSGTLLPGGGQTSGALGEAGKKISPALILGVPLVTEGKQTSLSTGDLLVKAGKQASQNGRQRVNKCQKQIKKKDLPSSKKSQSTVYSDPPDRPPSSFMLWLNAHRKKIRKQNPGLGTIEFSRKAGEMWNALEDKTKWKKKAAKSRKEYEKIMKELRDQRAERQREAADEEKKELSKICRESALSLRNRKIPKSCTKSRSSNQAELRTNNKSKGSSAAALSSSSSSVFSG